MIKITAYTDGSAVANGKNKGLGGLGIYFPPNKAFGETKYGCGYENTKTGRMELMALIGAVYITAMNTDPNEVCRLLVVSDSQYVVNSIEKQWLFGWRDSNWKNGTVKNIDLWKKLLGLFRKYPHIRLSMHWNRGHIVDKEKDPKKKEELLRHPHIYGNFQADALADYKQYEVRTYDKKGGVEKRS